MISLKDCVKGVDVKVDRVKSYLMTGCTGILLLTATSAFSQNMEIPSGQSNALDPYQKIEILLRDYQGLADQQAQMKKKLLDKENTIKLLNKKLSLQEEALSLQSSEQSGEAKELIQQLTEKEKAFKQAEEEKTRVQSALINAAEHNNKLKEEVARLQEQLKNQPEAERASLSRQKVLEDKIDSLTEDLEISRGFIEKDKELIERLVSENDALNQKIAQLSSSADNSSSARENKELKQKFREMVKQFKEVRKSIPKMLDDAKSPLEEEINALRAQIKQVESKAPDQILEAKAPLESKAEALERKLQKADEILREKDYIIESLTKENSELKGEFFDVMDENASLRNTLNDYKKKTEYLNSAEVSAK